MSRRPTPLKISSKTSLFAIGLVLIPTLILGTVTIWSFRSLVARHQADTVEQQALLESRRLNAAFGELTSDVRFLSTLPLASETLLLYAARENPKSSEFASEHLFSDFDVAADLLANVFSEIGRAKPDYEQLRLIDADGQEIVRIQRGSEGPVRISDSELQNKAGRPYVSSSLRTGTDKVQYSPIDLNREHGVLQIPVVPVLRATRIIRGPKGRILGLVVINLAFRTYIEELFRAGTTTFSHYLADDRGDWVWHPDPAMTFGRDLGNPQLALRDNPSLATLYANTDLDVLVSTPSTRTDELAAYCRVYPFPAQPDRFLILGVTGSYAGARAQATAIAYRALFLTIVLLILGLLFAWDASRRLTRPLTDLTRASDNLTAGAREVDLPYFADDEMRALATAFQRMVRSVRESEQRLDAILESTADGVFSTDETGVIATFNASCERIFGYAANDVVGLHLGLLVPNDEPPSPVDWVREPHEPRVEIEGQRADGSPFRAYVLARRVDLAGGTLYTITVQDVSELRRAESRLRETNRSLLATNHELDAFVYSASHDLRAPLRSMLGLVDLSSRMLERDDTEKAEQYLPLIRQNVERLDRLVVDLLAISRVDRDGVLTEFCDLEQLIDECFQELAHMDSAKEVALSRTVETDGPVEIDRPRLTQVLRNLIANGIAYRDLSRLQCTVHVSAVATGDFLEIRVRDDGVGIPPEFRERVFAMFSRGEDRGNGSGLGLYISKKQVRHMGGTIDYSSGPGGTEFHVRLPLTKKATV